VRGAHIVSYCRFHLRNGHETSKTTYFKEFAARNHIFGCFERFQTLHCYSITLHLLNGGSEWLSLLTAELTS